MAWFDDLSLKCPKCDSSLEYDHRNIDIGMIEEGRIEIPVFCPECDYSGTALYSVELVALDDDE